MIKLEVGKFYIDANDNILKIVTNILDIAKSPLFSNREWPFIAVDIKTGGESFFNEAGHSRDKYCVNIVKEWQETEKDRLWKFEQENPGLTIAPLPIPVTGTHFQQQIDELKKVNDEHRKEIEALKIAVSRIKSMIWHYWL